LLITLRGTGNLIVQTLSKWQVYQARRKQAQKSMAALPPEYADVLWYLWINKTRRFAVKVNGTVYAMEAEWCLLDRHNPAGWAVPMHAYYKVPGYVWHRIEKRLGPTHPGKASMWLKDMRRVP
jgi:hypothetical protein